MDTQSKLNAALKATQAIAEAIRELKEVPSGHLYANLMNQMSLDTYNQILDVLTKAKLISVDGFHLITWIGPQA